MGSDYAVRSVQLDAVLVSVGQALDWGRVRCYALDPYTDRSLLNIVNTT